MNIETGPYLSDADLPAVEELPCHTNGSMT